MSSDNTVLVRPRRSLLSTAFLSIVLGMLPVFGVLYWFGVQHGTWVSVFVVQVVISTAAVLILVRQLSVYTAVTASELKGRGIFSPMEIVSLDDIASVTIVPTLSGQSPEPIKQLLVRDAQGRRLFRMRGNFWHPGDLTAVADALPVIPIIVTEPITTAEFYRSYPGSAYWFENRRGLRIALIGAGVIVATIAVLGVARLVGVQLY